MINYNSALTYGTFDVVDEYLAQLLLLFLWHDGVLIVLYGTYVK